MHSLPTKTVSLLTNHSLPYSNTHSPSSCKLTNLPAISRSFSATSNGQAMNEQPLPAILMPLSCVSDGDLLCGEDTSEILTGDSTEYSSDLDSSSPSSSLFAEEEESIAIFIDHERKFVPGFDYLSRFQSCSLDANAREESVAWILKVHAYYGFQPLTAYLSVNYMDRFLDSRTLPVSSREESNGWPLQLLSVACLSLAAKMEEPLVPSLLDLQVEGAKYIFQPRTILRMELLVLTVLDWRLRSVTPLSFLSFFACKLDSTGAFTDFLISRATEIILSNIQEAGFLAYRPSCIAAAAILSAANEIPNWSFVKPEHAESWCEGLRKEKIIGCYELMQEIVISNNQRNPPKVLPQLRVTTRTRRWSNVSSSFPSSSSSPSFLLSYKKRKLNSNCFWVDDDKGNSE
ncbi:cyclin-D1-1 isoform X1 [Lathyrus oleraceus]|uniref:cyclin-D1-1 isoform X1 n=1 Tax=Pisum sativum TaxID=3888 RepID=UPI001FC42D00|nr:cyclin-D1-1-like isoform X1 [Pisum sativum]